jgi:small subunit ribosomal protein S8
VLRGQGIYVLSTPKGVLSDRVARKENVGGEILCQVY